VGRSSKVIIAQRPDGQKGLFLTAPAAKDEILITYTGEILPEPTRYSMQIDEHKHIEGTEDTNAYLNHSCQPSACVDFRDMVLRARRDIEAGGEITIDYNIADEDLHEKFTCHCGAAHCYGEVRGFKYLTREQKLRLQPYLSPYLRKKLNKEHEDESRRRSKA
jgi:hypothetical protein